MKDDKLYPEEVFNRYAKKISEKKIPDFDIDVFKKDSEAYRKFLKEYKQV